MLLKPFLKESQVRRGKNGFTIVELLTVLSIITILVSLLIPAISMVRRNAKEAQQKSQLANIEMALTSFKSDYGSYPPSSGIDRFTDGIRNDYCGAQKLAEALLGLDLLGFHPDSTWRSDGLNLSRLNRIPPLDPRVYPPHNQPTPQQWQQNLNERTGRYLELENANAFRLGTSSAGGTDGLFDIGAVPQAPGVVRGTGTLAPGTFVLCDVFAQKKVTNQATQKTEKAGTPILYYRADTSSNLFVTGLPDYNQWIYNIGDNQNLVALGKIKDRTQHSMDLHHANNYPAVYGSGFPNFYNFDHHGGIGDSKVSANPWPHRFDSYILISAGPDGEYGTADDIRNF